MKMFHYKKKSSARLFAFIVFVSSLALLYGFNPNTTVWMPRCPFHEITGLECPGCGTLRAIHEVLHGNLSALWLYNPYLIIIVPYIGIVFYASCIKRRSLFGELGIYLTSKYAVALIACCTLLWWIVRNLRL